MDGLDPNFNAETLTREETISNAILAVNTIAQGVLEGEYTVVTEQATGENSLRLKVDNTEVMSENLEALLKRAAANGDRLRLSL